MTDARHEIDALMDALLAGDATAAQQARHDRLMRDDAGYRAEFEFQERAAGALRRWGTPGAASATRSGIAPPARSRRTVLALAAVLALAGLGAVIAWRAGLLSSGGGAGRGTAHPRLTAEGIYREAEAGGFNPSWRCETDAEFVDTVFEKMRRAVLLPMATGGVEVIGWSYPDASKPAVSPVSMWLFVRTADGPAVVIVDRLDRDQNNKGLAPGGSSDYHAFRRELNGLVLYEITKAESPGVIGHFVVPSTGDAGA